MARRGPATSATRALIFPGRAPTSATSQRFPWKRGWSKRCAGIGSRCGRLLDLAVAAQLVELGADAPGGLLQPGQELLLVGVDLLVGEDDLAEQGGLGGVDGAVGQH